MRNALGQFQQCVLSSLARARLVILVVSYHSMHYHVRSAVSLKFH